MSTVLAMLAPGPYAAAVLETAVSVAELTASTVEAIHVGDGASISELSELAKRHGVRLHLVSGEVTSSLIVAARGVDVLIVVLGERSRTESAASPGNTLLTVMQTLRTPVVVVPINAARLTAGAGRSPLIQRVLLPLEDGLESSEPIADALARLVVRKIEAVVVHVFPAGISPPMLDQPTRDLKMLGDEFLARNLPTGGRIALRAGSVADRVKELCRPDHADLVVMGWSQDASPGRAEVVKAVLGTASLPVLLLPQPS